MQHDLPTSFDSMKCTPMFDLQVSQSKVHSVDTSQEQHLQHNVDHTFMAASDDFSDPQPEGFTKDDATFADAQITATGASFGNSTSEQNAFRGSAGPRKAFGAMKKGLDQNLFPFVDVDPNPRAACSSAPAAMLPGTDPAVFLSDHVRNTLYPDGSSATSSEGLSGLHNHLSFLESSNYSANGSANPETYIPDYDLPF